MSIRFERHIYAVIHLLLKHVARLTVHTTGLLILSIHIDLTQIFWYWGNVFRYVLILKLFFEVGKKCLD